MHTVSDYMSKFRFVGSSVKSIEIDNPFVSFPADSEKTFDVVYKRILIEDCPENKQGIIQLDITVNLEKNDRKFKLHLVNEGCFSVPKETPDEEFEKILAINGRAALYSVSRAYIITVSSSTFMGGAVILPMLNFVKANDIEQSEK